MAAGCAALAFGRAVDGRGGPRTAAARARTGHGRGRRDRRAAGGLPGGRPTGWLRRRRHGSRSAPMPAGGGRSRRTPGGASSGSAPTSWSGWRRDAAGPRRPGAAAAAAHRRLAARRGCPSPSGASWSLPTPTPRRLALGAELARRPPHRRSADGAASRGAAAALLVVGDGAAMHTEKAPGYLDERAGPFDDAVAAALAAADPAALAALDPALAAELWASGRAPWQVLAGATREGTWTGRAAALVATRSASATTWRCGSDAADRRRRPDGDGQVRPRHGAGPRLRRRDRQRRRHAALPRPGRRARPRRRPAERAEVPHHLLDVLDVTETASVAAYQRAARAAVERLLAAGRTPVLVGGSGLYVQAVVDELEFPGTDPDLRAELAAELDRVGPAALHARLAAVDPAAAAAVLPSNGRRIVRALEVIALTGRPFAARLPEAAAPRYDAVLLGVDRAHRRARRAHRPPGGPDVRGRAGRRDPRPAPGPARRPHGVAGAGLPTGPRRARDTATWRAPRPTPSSRPAGSCAGSGRGSAATAGSSG